MEIDLNENDLVLIVKNMTPDADYEWSNVSVYVNGKETNFESLLLLLDSRRSAPVMRWNDEDHEFKEG